MGDERGEGRKCWRVRVEKKRRGGGGINVLICRTMYDGSLASVITQSARRAVELYCRILADARTAVRAIRSRTVQIAQLYQKKAPIHTPHRAILHPTRCLSDPPSLFPFHTSSNKPQASFLLDMATPYSSITTNGSTYQAMQASKQDSQLHA